MLEMKNIKKIYRTELIETHALEDFSLHVEAGEFVSIMGPSGSGKTTFLNVAGLLDTFESGTYLLDGKDVSRLSDSEMSRIRNQNIGFVFQSFNLIPDLNVFDNVDVPLRYRGLSAGDRKRRIEGALELVGLSSRMEASAVATLGRPAAARRDRARAGRRSEADPGRRADRQPRLAHGARDHGPPRRDQQPRDDDRHGHAQPGMRGARLARSARPRRPRGRSAEVARDCGARDARRRRRIDVELRTNMLAYNIRIAAKSLRRNPYLTALLLAAIALGICVSTTFTTLRHAFAKDPLPGKSSKSLLRPDGQLGSRAAVSRR